jgi:SAM-dependent methyltransferase
VQSRSFGSAAERYDRYRPAYATDAVVWALGASPSRVADVGAGTGILSRAIRRLGHEVVAIEPDDRMRAHLVKVSPGITALSGTAEELALPDDSVDAIVAGQAYHWFDPEPAHREFARVLRPGGVFAVLRNDPDPATPWTVRFAEIIDGPAAEPAAPELDELQYKQFRHEMWVTPDELEAMATTRSPYLIADDQGRRELVEAIRSLLAGPELAGRERILMPHLTRVWRTRRHG